MRLAEPNGKRGRSAIVTDAAMQACLTLRALFGLQLRQATGLVASFPELAGLDWPVPDVSTLCRHQKGLNVPVAYATEPMTRQDRAEGGAQAIKGNFDDKLVSLLTFVLGQYDEAGAEGLDRSNLPVFLQLKYGNPVDGAKALGGADRVAGSYVDFQKHLYHPA